MRAAIASASAGESPIAPSRRPSAAIWSGSRLPPLDRLLRLKSPCSSRIAPASEPSCTSVGGSPDAQRLAQMVGGARARVLGEDRARPLHATPQHPARLLVVALRLERAGVQVLALEHRGGARGG
jgi:hypothetical protein